MGGRGGRRALRIQLAAAAENDQEEGEEEEGDDVGDDEIRP